MMKTLICGATAALLLSSSVAFGQDGPAYRADFGNKQYTSTNGVAHKEMYGDEVMVGIVDVKIKQTDSGPKIPGRFKVGASNFNPRGSSVEAETTADAEKPVRLVTFIAIGTGFGNKYQGEMFKRASAIEPAGAPVDGVKPQWMIGGLNEGPRRADESMPADQVAERLFGTPTDAEAAARAAENKALIEQALRDQLAAGSDVAKKIGETRLGTDEDVKRFFSNAPAGLDLAPFAEIHDAARLRQALDLIGIQVLGGGKTDAAIMTKLASAVSKLPAQAEKPPAQAPLVVKPETEQNGQGTSTTSDPSQTDGLGKTVTKKVGAR